MNKWIKVGLWVLTGAVVLTMQRDVVRTDYAPNDRHGQNLITETTREQFGFAKDGEIPREIELAFLRFKNWNV